MSTVTTLAVPVVNGNPAERILVIARTYGQFRYWCREREVNPNAANIRLVLRENDLRGYSNEWFVLLGVPDGRAGDALWHLLERRKAQAGLKNAETIKEEPPE